MKLSTLVYGSVLSLVGAMFVSIFTPTDVFAAPPSTPCMVINESTGTATYYTQGSVCGSGSGIALAKITQDTSARQITYASGGFDNETCVDVETWSLGRRTAIYCIQYVNNETSASVNKGEADGRRTTYSMSATTTAKLDLDRRADDEGYQARMSTVWRELSPELAGFKTSFRSTCASGPGSSDCVDSQWNRAIYECFQQSLNLPEDQTTGSAEQTE